MAENRYAKQLYTAPDYGTGFLGITKCGSTFLKNLFWRLNFGAIHPDPGRIHAYDDDFPRGGTLSFEAVASESAYFVVVRHPVARFLSVYFDKFQEPLRPSAPTNVFRRIIGDMPAYDWSATSTEQHVVNLGIAIEALEFSLASKEKRFRNPHWAPQSRRVNRFAKPLRLAALTVKSLDDQLGVLLSPTLPEIASMIAEVKKRNSGNKKPKGVLVDAALERRILQLYAEDFEIWSQVSEGWASCEGPASIPRFSG